MSDNGPHMQPPYNQGDSGQNPQMGPYGNPRYGPPPPHGPGEPSRGEQQPPPPYPGAPYPGQEHYGSGPQPAYPQDPGMYQGGPPPYGPGPSGDMPPYPPPPPKKSNIGLVILGAGGAIILVLMVIVVVLLARDDSEGEVVAAPDPAAEEPEEAAEEEEAAKDEEEVVSEVGEPPHELPESACDAFSESSLEELDARQSSTSTDDWYATCRWEATSAEGYPGELRVQYAQPITASDSSERAADDFEYRLDVILDESNEIIESEVQDNEELDLGDEAFLNLNSVHNVWNYSEASLLIRQDNMVIEITWRVDPMDILDDSAPAPLEYTEAASLLPDLGRESLNNLG